MARKFNLIVFCPKCSRPMAEDPWKKRTADEVEKNPHHYYCDTCDVSKTEEWI